MPERQYAPPDKLTGPIEHAEEIRDLLTALDLMADGIGGGERLAYLHGHGRGVMSASAIRPIPIFVQVVEIVVQSLPNKFSCLFRLLELETAQFQESKGGRDIASLKALGCPSSIVFSNPIEQPTCKLSPQIFQFNSRLPCPIQPLPLCNPLAYRADITRDGGGDLLVEVNTGRHAISKPIQGFNQIGTIRHFTLFSRVECAVNFLNHVFNRRLRREDHLERLDNFSVHRPPLTVGRTLNAVPHALWKAKDEFVLVFCLSLFHSALFHTGTMP